ncbi:hypothetical protein HY968_00055 [Candidatus Kaiserbacteria bacterium]|nr:hypothetical protein [Candidatus Kaiserbacteria bacterium]
MDQQIPGKWMVAVGVIIAVVLFSTHAEGTLAYVFYGLAAILVGLGVLNWKSR